MTKPLQPRAAQREFERGMDRWRIAAFLTRRQFGKTTEAARIALKKMMRARGHTVIFGSLKLDLGREIIRKESEVIQRTLAGLGDETKQAGLRLDVVDASAHDNKGVLSLKPDDFAELYEAQRLEFRLYFSQTSYSRTKVVALTTDAVGETGDLILDEIGRVKNFLEVWEAVKPIISSNPEFRCILTTTPPPDDTHYSFELLAPPIGYDPAPNPLGNWYLSELGIHCLRVTAWDAEADGVKLYDDETGAAITPNEARAKDPDKDGWDRNYAVKFVIGGSAACDLVRLKSAQERGIGTCQNFIITSDMEMTAALNWLAENIDAKARVGIGYDVATTTKATSNPSVVSIVEEHGPEWIVRARFVWKTKDPDIANARVDDIIDTIARRGQRAVAMAQDATNERNFAETNKKRLRSRLPVILVVASESVVNPDRRGLVGNYALDKPTNWKEYLGDRLVAKLDDNNLTLPPDRYTFTDYRLVMKDRGKFVCEPNDQGMHGDCFDADKLGGQALGGGGNKTVVPDYRALAAASEPDPKNPAPWPPYGCEAPGAGQRLVTS